MFFIQQTNDHDCGFTCLKILLANAHNDQNYLFLPSPFKEDKDISFLSLIKEAEVYKTTLSPLNATNKDELSSSVEVPFIARLNIDNVFHAVYVYKIGKKYVYYFDPSKGKKKLRIDEFIYLWTGELIAIKEVNKYKCPFNKPKFMKLSESIISLIISFISVISAVLAVYFINKESYIYLPIIFFSVMLISELIQKKYSLIVMKHIDNRVEEMVGNIKKKDYYGFYVDYESYKKYLLINNISFFSSFCIILFISLVFIINDKMNFIFIVLNILLGLTYALIVKPLLNEDEKVIMEYEERIKKADEKVEAFSYMKEARNKSYKYVDKHYAYRYVAIALQIILTFIMMMYNELVNITYIICYTVLQFYLYENIISILLKSDDFYKQDNLLNKIINNIENK